MTLSDNTLQDKVETILSYLKADKRYNLDFLPRPFLVEITGTQCAGKTTLISELDNSLRSLGMRVYCPQENAQTIRHIERTDPTYNIRKGLEALEQLLDLRVSHLYDLVIFERCIFDAYVWMEYNFEKNMLTSEEKSRFQEFFLSRLWASNIDVAFFVTCDADIAMKRELKISLSDKFRFGTNPIIIQMLVEKYKKTFEMLSPQYHQLHLLDTTNLTEQEMVEQTANIILSTLEKKSKSGSRSALLSSTICIYLTSP